MSPIEPFTTLSGRVAVLPRNDVDTDQIVPKRFLTRISRSGWGECLFYDWRYDEDGRPVDGFPLNDDAAAGASVLVAGDNFGCGSSREHAVWSLQEHGFRAVVAGGFADIFENNALRLGLAPVRLSADDLRALTAELSTGDEVVVDLEAQVVRTASGVEYAFPFDAFYRESLMRGLDEIGTSLAEADAIDAYERANPARVSTTAVHAVVGGS